jgi:glycosyltransferase involved in cell wall biosynthesis
MKVLQIITRLDRGGSSESLLLHAISLRQKGETVGILYGATAAPEEELIAQARSNGVEFILLATLVRDIRPLADLRALAGIYRVLCTFRPDIIHTHTSKAGFLGRAAAWLYRVRAARRATVIHSTHGHVFYGYYGRLLSNLFVLLEKLAATVTDRIVVLTANEREEHLTRGIGRRGQFRVVHSGIVYEDRQQGTVLRSRLDIPENALVIGSAGRLDPVKGYLTFIEAAGILNSRQREQRLFFLLIGDGSQRSEIEDSIRRYRLSGSVAITGWVKNPDDYIANVDIYVQPSLNEGLGKTILSAQRRGKPVIATRVQGIVSLITDNATGLLVEPGKADDLARAMGRLAADPVLREHLGANARTAIEQRSPDTGYPLFSVEQMNYLFEQLYGEFRT